MTQGEEESLEEYIERFQYNLQRSKQRKLGNETLKSLLLKGIQAEYLEVLNLMGTGNVFQLAYDNICELCRRYQKETSRLVIILRTFIFIFEICCKNKSITS